MKHPAPQKPPVSRRTLVSAAAWTAPAIAMTAASPAAAASTPTSKPTIEFSTFPPPAKAGEVFGDIVIAATTDGVTPVPAGALITVTLTGTTLPGGATTKTFVATGGPDSVTVSGISSAPLGENGAGTIWATYETAQIGAILRVEATAAPRAGTVYAWGYNAEGQIGDGKTGLRTTPAVWLGTEKYTSIFGAWASFAAVTTAGTVFATGNNFCGPFANGKLDGNSRSGPVGPALVADLSRPFTNAARVVPMQGALDTTTWIFGTDGQLYAAGENAGGQFSLKDGSTAHSADKAFAKTGFTVVGTEILRANPGKTITYVSCAGWYRSLYLLSDGTVWNAGKNWYSAMGNNGTQDTQYLAAQTVKADGTPLTGIVAAIATQDASMYLDGDGVLWGADYNGQGQLPGTKPGSVSKTAVPLTQPAGKLVKRIWGSGADISSYVAETTDGAFYVTGGNVGGSGSTGSRNATPNVWTPMIVPPGKAIADITFGNDGAVYLMTDGTVFFAGRNDTGGPGTGTTAGFTTVMTQVPLPGPAIDIAATWYDSYAAILAD
ncbi:MAG: hypothetical protein J0I18_17815 [Actinobacteria bacterium]|nr:hypothetical protein [Actinomycetota bacterium]